MLVPQDAKDEPASELLARIAKEKVGLVRAGKLRKAVLPQSRPGADGLFSLPSGWCWARVQDLTLLVTDGDHQPPPQTESGVPFVVIGNVSSGQIDLTATRFVSRDYYDGLDWTKKPRRGDLLYTVTGSWGIVLSVNRDDDFCVQRHIGILKTSAVASNQYLRFALSSAYARDLAARVATGIAQKTVPLTGLRSLPIPVPPSPSSIASWPRSMN